MKARLSLVGLAAAVIWVSLAVAQEEEGLVELTPTQLDLNNRAIEALREEPPDTATAIHLVDAALMVGPQANVLFLTKGRVLQLMHRCREARSAFRTAVEAPPVAGVADEQIRERIERYRSDLAVGCPGRLHIFCNHDDTRLESDGLLESPRCGAVLEEMPGDYVVRAALEGRRAEYDVEVRALEHTTLYVSLGPGRSQAMAAASTRLSLAIDAADELAEAIGRRVLDRRQRRAQ